jgi:hypothetical protein
MSSLSLYCGSMEKAHKVFDNSIAMNVSTIAAVAASASAVVAVTGVGVALLASATVVKVIGVMMTIFGGISFFSIINFLQNNTRTTLNDRCDRKPESDESVIDFKPRVYNGCIAEKPNIYLYYDQEKELKATVNIEVDGELFTIPKKKDFWNVTINLDNKISDEIWVDTIDGFLPYSFLFWEAKLNNTPEIKNSQNSWFIKGDQAQSLFNKILHGFLNTKERTDFINYWAVPSNFDNEKYYKINFQETPGDLKISPTPNEVVRLCMFYSEIQKEEFDSSIESNEKICGDVYGPKTLEEVGFSIPSRKGFCVIEWGGINLTEKIVK